MRHARSSFLSDGMAACVQTGCCVSLPDSMRSMHLLVRHCRWTPMLNSSTVTTGRLAGFGGAPNMGHDPHGRRHSTKAWLDLITEDKPIIRGRKLVVQTVETFQSGGVPAFVETLDAVHVGQQAGMPIAPVMIYGDDVSHVVTEEGIAYLYKAEGQEERRRALAAVAGVSPVGQKAVASETAALRK